eukprot:Tbor_TRINITY_DN4434_c0_g1::TRINITY_DN4434_c0_g1_i1::g.7915::m.7915
MNDSVTAGLLGKCSDFSDIISLAAPSAPGFKIATEDPEYGIVMLTRPVPELSPVHMMKAEVIMPCPPHVFLRYLDTSIRTQWDEHLVIGDVIRHLEPTVFLKHMEFKSPLTLFRNRDFELIVAERICPDGTAMLKTFSTPRGMLRPEKGTAYPSRFGRLKDGSASCVRGDLLISGFVAKPLFADEHPLSEFSVSLRHLINQRRINLGDAADDDAVICNGKKRRVVGCKVTYIVLVQPNGRIPSILVNTVIGRQTSGLKILQRYIVENPLSDADAKRSQVSKL